MQVITDERTYTLYIGADGIWTMHAWASPAGGWVNTFNDVSTYNPFSSRVDYDAWR